MADANHAGRFWAIHFFVSMAGRSRRCAGAPGPQILLITSLTTKRWIIPKGWLTPRG
jgi:hypothetical protein